MEIAVEPNPNVELIHLAIQKLIDEKKNREASGRSFIEDDDDHLLLSKLLSQLESLKGDVVLKASPERAKDSCPAAGTAEMTKSVENGGGRTKLETAEEIVKELKEVKRQNSRTHWLLSAMIVLTVVWQLSEVSLILKLKNSFSNPFKSVGGMFMDMLKGKGPPDNNNGHNGEKHSSPKQQQNESAAATLPPLKLPELPHMDLHGLGLNGDQ